MVDFKKLMKMKQAVQEAIVEEEQYRSRFSPEEKRVAQQFFHHGSVWERRQCKEIIHENLWWWGKSYTLIADDGKSMVELSIEDDDEHNYYGTIQSLIVHESVRQQGRGNALLKLAEEKAMEIGLKQVVLCARKGTFLIPWYQRNGYEIYDENPEYSKGNTVAMNKYFD